MKKAMVFAIVAGVMWIGSAEVCAVNYYIDATGGNDSWNGNYPSYEGGVNGPWKTIAKVNDYAENPRFSDGDAICLKRGEVWRNDETIGYDTSTIYWGTLNGLTIQDYGTGAKPWIDGSTQAAIYFYGYDKLSNLVIRNIDVSGMGWAGSPEIANIYVRGVTNITIDDIYADGHKGTPTEFVVKGPIKIGPNLGDLVIKNCEIFNIMQRDTLYRGPVNQYTITINNYHVSAHAKTTGSVKIINNTVHDVVGDILQPANVRPPGGFLIADNVFYHFGENAIDLKSCSNVIIENNEIYRDFGGSDKYCEETWPDKIFNFGMIVTHRTGGGTDPTCENIIIRNNYIYSAGNFRTFEIGGANNLQIYDNYFKDVGRIELSTNRCTVHNNIWDVTHDPVCDDFIYCSLGTTSCSASTLSLIAPSPYMRSCKIFNNTFYTKSNTMNYGMYYKKYSTSVNNEIFNNIFYFDRDYTNSYPLYFYIRDGSSDIPDVHNNLYFNPSGTNRIFWNWTIYDSTEQTAWQNAGHPGDIFADPLFVDPENSGFHLQSTSPMIDTGTFLTTITSNTASSQTSFTVVDAGCFYDGWGIPGEVGNAIKTQNGQITTVQTIDYDTNTITVNPAINIVNNEGIALNYEGSAPDVGAFEFTGIAQFPIDQTNWSLLYVDSEELGGESGAATNSFDGDLDTIWHTEWPENPSHPHEIQIDLGGFYDICGFRYLPRQGGGENGTIKDYEFYVSNNTDDWGTAIASGTFANDKMEKQVSFDCTLSQYVRLIALSEVNGGPWTSMAELNVLAVQPDTDINDDGKINIEDFAVLSVWWDNENECSSPDWCEGSDFNMSGTVDMFDLAYFAENWLRQAD